LATRSEVEGRSSGFIHSLMTDEGRFR